MTVLDFEYLTDQNGYVTLEVTVSSSAPDPYSVDSDWDFYGSFYIEDCKVFQQGTLVEISIPEQEVYALVKNKLRTLDIEQSFEEG